MHIKACNKRSLWIYEKIQLSAMTPEDQNVINDYETDINFRLNALSKLFAGINVQTERQRYKNSAATSQSITSTKHSCPREILRHVQKDAYIFGKLIARNRKSESEFSFC